MPKKHKTVQRKENSQKKQKVQAKEQAATTATHPLSPSTIIQLQQQHGNAFVERYLQRETAVSDTAVQRAEEDKEAEAEQAQQDPKKVAEARKETFAEKIDMQIPAQYHGDTLELDLGNLIDLKKFSTEAGVYSQAIEEWGGMGAITLMEKETFGVLDLENDQSGKFKLELDPAFQHNIEATVDANFPERKPNLTNLFGSNGLELTASLHYNLEDAELKESNLDIPNDWGDDKILPYPILLLQFEGECGKGILPESIPIQGAILLHTQIKNNIEPQIVAPIAIVGESE